jgi:hypothetical protein
MLQNIDVGGNHTASVAGPLNGTNVTVANKTVAVTGPGNITNVTTNGTANTTTVTVNLPGVGQLLSIGINSGG